MAVVTAGTPAYGPVVDRGDTSLRVFRVERDRYATGNGEGVLKIRGSVTSFGQFDGSPAWQAYGGPTVQGWRYVQLRIDGTP